MTTNCKKCDSSRAYKQADQDNFYWKCCPQCGYVEIISYKQLKEIQADPFLSI